MRSTLPFANVDLRDMKKWNARENEITTETKFEYEIHQFTDVLTDFTS